LKTIEEPPEYIIFIFATTELQKVPATIRSRCQQFNFQLIPTGKIKALLKEASDEMGIGADDDALFWIAKEAGGSMRDAYTLFDQVASFSKGRITLAEIKDKLGIVGSEQIAKIVSLAISNNPKAAVEELGKVFSAGVSVEQTLRNLLEFFRALLLYKEGIEDEEILSLRKEEIPEDVVSTLTKEQLEAASRTLLQLYREIRY